MEVDEVLFWQCVSDGALPVELIVDPPESSESLSLDSSSEDNTIYYNPEVLERLNDIYRGLIMRACYALVEYFKKDSPMGSRFYADVNDPYDGIILGSDDVVNFIGTVIMAGRGEFEDFCMNPFKGDIMNYLRRGVSCGNSSCLYFIKYSSNSSKTWYSLIGYQCDEHIMDVDFYNRVFDMISACT